MNGRYTPDAALPPELPPRLLVVDDEPATVRLMEAFLKAEGYRTVSAHNGADALERLADGDVALVLLDIRMPHMDGFEVCRRIRANPRHRRLPVVFLTAELGDVESELQGLEAGADEYLHKPLHRRQLVVRVKNLLRLADAERDRRLIAQLAQTEKLAAVGQIAAGVAHEINNPLAFILSNLNSLHGYVADVREVIAAYRVGPELGQERERALGFEESLADIESLIRETAQGGERVRRIVQELKTFSRADDTADCEEVDLAEVAASTLMLTERELATRARVVKELNRACVAKAPRGKLHQLVLNLLVNALQALEGGEPQRNEIRVRTGLEGPSAVLAVSDTGCGIPEAQQRRIFEPFFTTKPLGVGTGIGLSVCAAVVEKLGGNIDVQSEVGKGTTFVVRVPAYVPTASGELDAV